MDGVLANFVGGIIKSHNLGITHDECDCWDFHRKHGLTDEQFWSPTNDGKWWTELEEYPWSKRLVLELRRLGEVIFCTSPSLDATCPSQKVAWLRSTGLMHENKNDYQIGGRKELNAGSGAILIDDSDSNVEKYRYCGGEAILFPQPWNKARRFTGDKVDYVLHLLQMADHSN